jgi:hypothetical protein
MLLRSNSPLLHIDQQLGKQHTLDSGSDQANFISIGYSMMRENPSKIDNDNARALLSSLEWINVQAELLDICIAFYPLDLPSYVVLEIVDKFPFWSTHVNRKKKIDYIIQIKRFCDQLIDKRDCSI